jgi:NAD(P)-dependent dehydrogenase (short-subunit alcohol dehydrogenase family)
MPTGNNGMNMGYRMSKTALNQMSVTMAKEILSNDDNITVIALYPGHLATRMSNFSSSNDMETSITGVVDVIENVNIEQTGSYLNWEGKTVPW